LAASAIALGVLLVVPANAFISLPSQPVQPAIAATAHPAGHGLDPYRGLGTWVDMYNRGPWRYPAATAWRMHSHGVHAVFVETANYRSKHAVYRPAALARLIEAAHAKGMKIVAWTLPSLKHPRRDFRRAHAAIAFTTPSGQHFNGFALDIESTVVRDLSRRNARLAKLSAHLRRSVGPSYALGAIVPDPVHQQYWTDFPYGTVTADFNIVLPMSYFTLRTHGKRRVYRYTSANIRAVRKHTGDPAEPVHVIGGIAGDATPQEVAGFVSAARASGSHGASLYDFPITTGGEWSALSGAETLGH
jgi:hypothetical protein